MPQFKPSREEEPELYSYANNSTDGFVTHEERKKYKDVVLPLAGLPVSFDFWGKIIITGELVRLETLLGWMRDF